MLQDWTCHSVAFASRLAYTHLYIQSCLTYFTAWLLQISGTSRFTWPAFRTLSHVFFNSVLPAIWTCGVSRHLLVRVWYVSWYIMAVTAFVCSLSTACEQLQLGMRSEVRLKTKEREEVHKPPALVHACGPSRCSRTKVTQSSNTHSKWLRDKKRILWCILHIYIYIEILSYIIYNILYCNILILKPWSSVKIQRCRIPGIIQSFESGKC